MTIKHKIKTWHIVVLIILGIGGYWLSQNMWVFEKQIPVEEYEEFLVGTQWEGVYNWKFISNESLKIHPKKNDTLNWRVSGELLYIFYEENPSIWKIEHLGIKNMIVSLIKPSVMGNNSNIKLRLNEK